MGLIVIDAKVFGRFTPGAKQLHALCSAPYQHLRNVSGDDILAREQMIQIHIHRDKAPFFDFLIGFVNAVTFLWSSGLYSNSVHFPSSSFQVLILP